MSCDVLCGSFTDQILFFFSFSKVPVGPAARNRAITKNKDDDAKNDSKSKKNKKGALAGAPTGPKAKDLDKMMDDNIGGVDGDGDDRRGSDVKVSGDGRKSGGSGMSAMKKGVNPMGMMGVGQQQGNFNMMSHFFEGASSFLGGDDMMGGGGGGGGNTKSSGAKFDDMDGFSQVGINGMPQDGGGGRGDMMMGFMNNLMGSHSGLAGSYYGFSGNPMSGNFGIGDFDNRRGGFNPGMSNFNQGSGLFQNFDQGFQQGVRGAGGGQDFDSYNQGGTKASNSYSKYGKISNDFPSSNKRASFPSGSGIGGKMVQSIYEDEDFQRMMIAKFMEQNDDTRSNGEVVKKCCLSSTASKILNHSYYIFFNYSYHVKAMKQMGNVRNSWHQGNMKGMDMTQGINQNDFSGDAFGCLSQGSNAGSKDKKYMEQNLKSLMQGTGKGGSSIDAQHNLYQRQLANLLGNSGLSSTQRNPSPFDAMRGQLTYESGMYGGDGSRLSQKLRNALNSSQYGSNSLGGLGFNPSGQDYCDSKNKPISEKIQNLMQGDGNSGGYGQYGGRGGNPSLSNQSSLLQSYGQPNYPSNSLSFGGSNNSGGGGGLNSGGRLDQMAQLLGMSGASYQPSRDQRDNSNCPSSWANDIDGSFFNNDAGNFNSFRGL